MQELLKRSLRITALIVLIVSAVLAFLKHWLWLSGFIVGNSWSVLNFLLLANLFKISLQKTTKARLFLMLMIKFPVLYLIGFFILIEKFFPVWSLFCGLFTIIAVTLAVNLRLRQI